MQTVAGCLIITAFAVIVLRYLIMSNKKFTAIYDNFFNRTIIDRRKTSKQSTQNLEVGEKTAYINSEDYREDEWIDVEELKNNKEEYFKQYAAYVSASQMIAIFPLLGILGTVFGLASTGNMESVSTMLDGLTMALWTTIVGLIASIILKLYDSMAPGKMVNLIEAKISATEEAIRWKNLTDQIRDTRRAVTEKPDDREMR